MRRRCHCCVNHALGYNGGYKLSYSFSDALVHDKPPETALAYKAKVKNPLGLDAVPLSAALPNVVEWQLWKSGTDVSDWPKACV